MKRIKAQLTILYILLILSIFDLNPCLFQHFLDSFS